MRADLDYNLLKVLVLLNRHSKLKTVAKELGKSEASVSKYLSKLREQLDNELYFQDPEKGYVPTPFMESILPDIESSLDTLSHLLDAKTFDPLSITRTVSIATTDYVLYFYGAAMLDKFMTLFPNAKFRFTSWSDESPKQLLDGQIDLGVHMFNGELPKSIYQRLLKTVSYSLVFPERFDGLTNEEIFQMPFVIPAVKGWESDEPIQKSLVEKAGIKINVLAEVDSISSILSCIDRIGGVTIIATPRELPQGYIGRTLDLQLSNVNNSALLVKANNRNNAFYKFLMEQFY